METLLEKIVSQHYFVIQKTLGICKDHYGFRSNLKASIIFGL